MISSDEGDKSNHLIEGSRRDDKKFGNSLVNAFSFKSMSSTVSVIADRTPALSSSSLSTLEEYSACKVGEEGGKSGFVPLSPASDTRNNNGGKTNLSHGSFKCEYEYLNQMKVSKMHHKYPKTYVPSVEVGERNNTDIFHNESTLQSSNMNNLCEDKIDTFDDNIYKNQIEFQNYLLLCNKTKEHEIPCGSSQEIDGCIYPLSNYQENYQAVQDRAKYNNDIDTGCLNSPKKDMHSIDLNAVGQLGSRYDTSFSNDRRKSSTIHPKCLPFDKMRSVNEYKALTVNCMESSSHHLNSGNNFKNHNSQPSTVFPREVSFDQDFYDKCSISCATSNADEPRYPESKQESCLNTALGNVQDRSSVDKMSFKKFNDLEYLSKCAPSQSSSTNGNHQLSINQCSALDQNYLSVTPNTAHIFQPSSPSRQRVMSADGIRNEYQKEFQNQGRSYDYPGNDPDMRAGCVAHFDSTNYNSADLQKNRPRSYSSGTNAAEYVRSQRSRMHSQFVPMLSERIHSPQQPGDSPAQQSPSDSFFAQNDEVHRLHHHKQGHNHYDLGSVLDTNVKYPQKDFSVNDRIMGCNYVSGPLSYNGPHLVDVSRRGGNMTPFDANTLFVRESPGSGAHIDSRNSSNNVLLNADEEVLVDSSPQKFTNATSISHYKSKRSLLKPRAKVVYNIKFKRTQRHFILGQRMHQDVQIGSYVKVEADRGEDLGIVISCIPTEKIMSGTRLNYRSPHNLNIECDINKSTEDFSSDISLSSSGGSRDMKRILRLATHDEILLLAVKKEEEENLLKVCREKIIQRGLPMNVVDAEYQFDRHKLTFFFEAEGRVDFRELVRDLFSMYKTRIWMQQIDKSTPGGDASCQLDNLNRKHPL